MESSSSSSSKEIGCRNPEGPILCINNCGFFGSTATMNMCSKCHKDVILKQEQTKQAANIINNGGGGGGSCGNGKEHPSTAALTDLKMSSISSDPPSSSLHSFSFGSEMKKTKEEGPNRCGSCNKRVGLTGFRCRCGNLFCSSHRYSEQHDCPYDYQTAGRNAISKANPMVKAEKLDKI